MQEMDEGVEKLRRHVEEGDPEGVHRKRIREILGEERVREIMAAVDEVLRPGEVNRVSNREGWGEPVNMAGVEFFEIEKIDVMEFHELPDGKGPPTEVHLMLTIADWPHPFIMRKEDRDAVEAIKI